MKHCVSMYGFAVTECVSVFVMLHLNYTLTAVITLWLIETREEPEKQMDLECG